MKYIASLVLPVLAQLLLVATSVDAVRSLRIVSPLQALTIWDSDDEDSSSGMLVTNLKNSTARSRFLTKLRAGLDAESRMRSTLPELMADLSSDVTRQQSSLTSATDWAERAAQSKREAFDRQELLLEAAFDKAVAPFEEAEKELRRKLQKTRSEKSASYQFVGVIGERNAQNIITWYARKKPTNSRWSVRLLHVNRDAILKDLFDQGKIDLFAKYENTGKINSETGLPIIASKYSVRERSWRNLWNFSPKHFFSDSSGMYWRERRLRPGIYTDGKNVYESSYRYRDGRNGMHRKSTLAQFLASKSIDEKSKRKAVQRLQKEAPDVVLED